MTDEEKKAAEQAQAQAEADAAEAAKKAADEAEANAGVEALALKEAEIARLTKERDNYKTVALKRLGKLDNDADFLAGEKDTGLTVEEQVKAALIERELEKLNTEKDAESKRLAKENAELKLALKNRPGSPIGGGSGSGASTEVKDNVFSEAQIQALREKAIRLKADPEKFIENAKKNLLARG